ncbi:MAG: histidine kinase [Parabacteroides sp.]|nr:histidine kinase [Parabacteroides sp.]
MVVDTKNSIVNEFLTESKFRLWRRLLFIAMLVGCSFGQVFLMFGKQIESLGYIAYIFGAVLALLYALLLHLNVTYLVPRFLLRGKYVEYITLLVVGTIAILLLVKSFAKYPILYPIEVINSFNAVSSLDMLASLIVAIICISSSLIPTLFRQWLIDTQNIDNLENKRLKSTIDEFKNHINTELLYDTIALASQKVKTAPEKASDMIISLSELLRYELYDCKRRKVILQSDIEFTRNYLWLVQQTSASFVYSISVAGNTNLFVPPFQFLSFIQERLRHQPEKLDVHYVISNESIEVSCEVSRSDLVNRELMKWELK